jgi:hypothetical protein
MLFRCTTQICACQTQDLVQCSLRILCRLLHILVQYVASSTEVFGSWHTVSLSVVLISLRSSGIQNPLCGGVPEGPKCIGVLGIGKNLAYVNLQNNQLLFAMQTCSCHLVWTLLLCWWWSSKLVSWSYWKQWLLQVSSLWELCGFH